MAARRRICLQLLLPYVAMILSGVMERCSAIDEEYYLGDYYYDNDYDYSVPNTGSSSSSSSLSVPSHKVVHEKSQENQQIAQAVQSHVQGKLIPEPGWMPLTDT